MDQEQGDQMFSCPMFQPSVQGKFQIVIHFKTDGAACIKRGCPHHLLVCLSSVP